MPVPMPSPEERRRMMEEGIGVSPHVPHSKHTIEELPSTGKKDLAAIVEQAGGPLFSQLDPKTVLQLPAIHKLNENMIVEIDGENYYVVHVVESKPVGKKSVLDGREYQKGEFYPGKIVCLRASDGEVVQFPFDGTVDRIRQPAENKQRIMDAMNKEIASYNNRLSNIAKAAGMTKINLQISAAEDRVNDRIEKLQGMISAIEQKRDNPQQSAGHAEWMNRLMDDIRNRRMSLPDAFHTISYEYQNRPEQLVSDIESGTLNIPDEIRQALLAMAHQEARNKSQKFEDERVEWQSREERKQEEWSQEEGVDETPLPDVRPEDIPGGKYTRLPAYSRPENIQSQTVRQLRTLNNDLQEITEVKNALTGLRGYIADLEKGQRSNAFMSSPEGQEVVRNVSTHLDGIKKFIKRYKTDIFEEGRINPRLFGTTGEALGNSLLAVTLNRIGLMIYKTIEPFIQRQGPPPTTTTETPVDTPTTPTGVQAKKEHDLTKLGMSDEFWSKFISLYRKD